MFGIVDQRLYVPFCIFEGIIIHESIHDLVKDLFHDVFRLFLASYLRLRFESLGKARY